MPAVHARDRIRLHRKREVLVHACLAPPDLRGVGIAALVRPHRLHLPEEEGPVLPLYVDERARELRSSDLAVEAPPSEVGGASDDPREGCWGRSLGAPWGSRSACG